MISVGSLFSGGLDGIGTAFQNAGMRVRWQIEQDEWRQQVLAKRFPRSQIFGDITHVKAEQLRPVDVMAGGFPCQDISSAGLRAGIKGARSGLWYEFARLIGELRPAIVFLENADEITAPIRERGTKRITDRAPGFAVLASLAEMGFDAQWGIVPASAVGAPHQRDRWWCIGWNIPNADRIRQRRQEATTIARPSAYHEQRHIALHRRGGESVVHEVVTSGRDALFDSPCQRQEPPLCRTGQFEPQDTIADRASANVPHPDSNALAEWTRQSAFANADSRERERIKWANEPNVGGNVFAGLSGRLERLARAQLWAAPLGLQPYPFEPARLVDYTPDWTNRVSALGDSICVPVAQAFAEGIKEAWHWLEAQERIYA